MFGLAATLNASGLFDPYSGDNFALSFDPAKLQVSNVTSNLAGGPFCSFASPPSGHLPGLIVVGCEDTTSASSAVGPIGSIVFAPGVVTGCSAVHLGRFGPPDNGDLITGTYTIDHNSQTQTNTYGNVDATICNIAPAALRVSKVAAQGTVTAGDTDSYSIMVTNPSATTPAQNVTVTDIFPAGITGVAAGDDPACVVTTVSATCTAASIAPGGSVTFDPINVLTDPRAVLTSPMNVATASCTGDLNAPPCVSGAGAAPITLLPPPVLWAKSPTNANVWLCGESFTGGGQSFGPDCPSGSIPAAPGTPTDDPGDPGPSVPNDSTGVWQDGVILDEVLSNPNDPAGLGGYQFDLSYDPNVFDPPVIQDAGQMNVSGHVTTCSMTIVVPGVVHIGCVAGAPLGSGASWLGTRTMATVRFDVAALVEKTIRPNKENGTYVNLVDTNTAVTNTCGQPLNDGTVQPLPGQPECQGSPLPGVGPGGSLADTEARYTVRRLEGDIVPDCAVDVADIQLEASKFGLSSGALLYDKFFDVNLPLQFGDGEIDINDVQFVMGRLGSTCLSPLPPQPPVPTP
ncbi:MAG TPA: cohesin domain-containing protein [Dehalococcoidia bacterium]|nr:cohesin domain-containing protein [Dehalococcoidia bacterium]